MKTKKQLREENARLVAELERMSKITAMIDNSELPKCKSLACVNCEHIAFTHYNGVTYILGCGKGKRCQDFKAVGDLRGELDQPQLLKALQSLSTW